MKVVVFKESITEYKGPQYNGWSIDDWAYVNKIPDVYFIQSEKGGPIKIGVSLFVEERLKELQCAHPYKLRILKIIKYGGYDLEQYLHEYLSEYRLMGEWFEWSDTLKWIINNYDPNNKTWKICGKCQNGENERITKQIEDIKQ